MRRIAAASSFPEFAECIEAAGRWYPQLLENDIDVGRFADNRGDLLVWFSHVAEIHRVRPTLARPLLAALGQDELVEIYAKSVVFRGDAPPHVAKLDLQREILERLLAFSGEECAGLLQAAETRRRDFTTFFFAARDPWARHMGSEEPPPTPAERFLQPLETVDQSLAEHFLLSLLAGAKLSRDHASPHVDDAAAIWRRVDQRGGCSRVLLEQGWDLLLRRLGDLEEDHAEEAGILLTLELPGPADLRSRYWQSALRLVSHQVETSAEPPGMEARQRISAFVGKHPEADAEFKAILSHYLRPRNRPPTK